MPETTRCRVMIADDAEDIRHLLRLKFEMDDRFDVVAEAADGKEAIEEAGAHSPDVVVLDISMPKLDGLQALPLIRSANPATRVIMLSGLDDADIEAQALASGAERFLVKTTDIDEILDAVASLCQSV